MTLWERLLSAAGLLMREPAPPGPEFRCVPARIPEENPLRDDGPGWAATKEAGLSLLDEDCIGFLLISVHRHDGLRRAEIRLQERLEPSWWPAVAQTLESIAERARERT